MNMYEYVLCETQDLIITINLGGNETAFIVQPETFCLGSKK